MAGTSEVACIVLAGGAGKRMGGVDKAALDVGGRTLLDRVLGAARPVCDPLVVVGPRRTSSVADVVFTTEPVPGGGPVPAVAAGLAAAENARARAAHQSGNARARAAHQSGGYRAVVVLAVDLPLLRSAELSLLLAALDDSSASAAAAADDRGRPNPLLAAYEVGALRACLAGLGRDPAGVAAARLLPAEVAIVDLGPIATLNVNRPDDLERARQLIKEAAINWPQTYATALAAAGGPEIELSDAHVDAVLDLAREVAHGTERRWAPVSTWLAGMFVAQRCAAGAPFDEALREAASVAAGLLEAGEAEPGREG